jgi:hypothetical protein
MASKPSPTKSLKPCFNSDKSQHREVHKQAADAQPDGSRGMNYSPDQIHTAFLPPHQSHSQHSPTPEAPVHDVPRDITRLIDQELGSDEPYCASWCFHNADLRPPITQESLAELDMPRIINNPKLRHDVNFDKELHFRPNLDGSKGKQKMAQADQYWTALEAELVLYAQVQRGKVQSPEEEGYWGRIMDAALQRLPLVFKAVRDILKTLVPEYDQKAVQERLDVDHIMQQIQNGVCDLIDLGNWLAKILKNHCAPMRDSLVDCMQEEIRRGAMDNRPKTLVNGLRQLMTILEAMKLDVANHQIRHMRPLLIDDTVNFQRRYNSHRIGLGKIDVEQAKIWLRNELVDLQHSGHRHPSPLQALTSGLLRDIIYDLDPVSVSSSSTQSFTSPTFYLDMDRLRTLRSDFHAQIYHSICREIMFEVGPADIPPAILHRAAATLQRSVASIVGTSSSHRFPNRTENIAVEIVRVVQRIMIPHTCEHSNEQPFDSDMLYEVESRLKANLHPSSDAFQLGADQLFERVQPRLQKKVNDHWKFAAVDLQDMLAVSNSGSSGTSSTSSTSSSSSTLPTLASFSGIGAKLTPPGMARTSTPSDFFPPSSSATYLDLNTEEDLIRRLAHILVLHWQVWADLVYHSVELPPFQSALDSIPPFPCSVTTPTSSSGVSPASSNESLNGTGAVLSHMGSFSSLMKPVKKQEEEERIDECVEMCKEVEWKHEDVEMSDGDMDDCEEKADSPMG